MVRIKFIKGGSSNVFGNFAPGDLLTCSEAEARHFVVDAECAEYAEPQPTGNGKAPAAARTPPKPRKR